MEHFKPTKFQWDGEIFTPVSDYWREQADRELVVGEVYMLTNKIPRSEKSHNHYFGCVAEAWEQLPEQFAADFPSPDHLRYRALIDLGYFNERILVASNATEAERIMKFMKSDVPNVVLSINHNVVIERTAKSQNLKEMDKKEFEQSKAEVLSYCSQLIGISIEDLKQNYGKAA